MLNQFIREFAINVTNISADEACHLQLKPISADIWAICRYSDMEKLSRYSIDRYISVIIGRNQYRSYSEWHSPNAALQFASLVVVEEENSIYSYEHICSLHEVSWISPGILATSYTSFAIHSIRRRKRTSNAYQPFSRETAPVAQRAGTGRKTDFGSQTKFQRNMLVRCQNYQKMQKLKYFMEGSSLTDFHSNVF